MLKCPECYQEQSNGADHLKHLRIHAPRYKFFNYKCLICEKTLKWNGYHRHAHIVEYVHDHPVTGAPFSSTVNNDNMEFDDVAKLCYDKWNEVKGRSNATSAFADEMFNFGKEMSMFILKKVQGPHRYDQMLSSSFKNVSSAYKRKIIVEKTPTFVKPTPYTIKNRFERVQSGGDVLLKQRDNDMAYINPRRSLEMLLQNESIIRILNMPSDFINNDKIDHVFSSQHSKDLMEKVGKDYTAVQIYADDFGTTNPLGYSSTTCKMNAFYLRVLNLPAALLSEEDFIILLSLAYTDDVKNRLQRLINQTIVPDFQELYDNGIDLNINGIVRNFPVVIFNIVGDNLGVHQLFSYLQSFNTLNPCRICKVTNTTLKTTTTLNDCTRKTEAEYDEIVNNGSLATMQQNGIRSKCSFNNLSYFHILRCQCLDLMHDVLEGCGKYLMLYVIRTLPIDQLNDAWSMFPFKRGDKSNCGITFTENQLKQDQLTSLTSSMMLTLIRFLPLVVAESEIVPKTETPWWSIYMDFVEIMDILMAQSLTEEKLVVLQILVEAYLKRYQEAGGHMTVKSHFFLHDPDVIREMGPLRWNWCMRYEAAHRQFKQYAVVNRNHQNVAITYAEKHQHNKMNFYEALNEPDFVQKHIQQKEIERFTPGSFVILRVDDNLPIFGCIKSFKQDIAMFHLTIYNTLSFDAIRHCYIVQATAENTTIPSFAFFVPEVMQLYSEKYIRLPYCIV